MSRQALTHCCLSPSFVFALHFLNSRLLWINIYLKRPNQTSKFNLASEGECMVSKLGGWDFVLSCSPSLCSVLMRRECILKRTRPLGIWNGLLHKLSLTEAVFHRSHPSHNNTSLSALMPPSLCRFSLSIVSMYSLLFAFNCKSLCELCFASYYEKQ